MQWHGNGFQKRIGWFIHPNCLQRPPHGSRHATTVFPNHIMVYDTITLETVHVCPGTMHHALKIMLQQLHYFRQTTSLHHASSEIMRLVHIILNPCCGKLCYTPNQPGWLCRNTSHCITFPWVIPHNFRGNSGSGPDVKERQGQLPR